MPEQIIFASEAEDYCLDQAEKMSETFGYATDVPLITRSDCRNKLARLAAAFAVLHVSADDHFTRLVIEREHAQLAVEYLYRLFSHDNCALDDYSEIMRIGSQLEDYERIEKAFLSKLDKEKHASDDEAGYFPRLVFALRTNKAIRRDSLEEQVGCSVETVKRTVRLLKRFNLIDSTRDGYVKKPKFNKFLRRFVKERPDFFSKYN